MRSNFLTVLIFFCLAITCKAQNFITQEHSYLTDFVFNPAVAGSEENTVALMSFKRNWTGIKTAPATAMLNIHTKATNLGLSKSKKFNTHVVSKIGLGLGVYSDRNGPLTTRGFQIAYAYHLLLNKETKLSMGLSSKLMQYGLNQDVFVLYDPNDPIVGNDRVSRFMLNFNFGFLVYHKKFHAGIASTNIGDFNDNYYKFYYEETVRALYLHGGYKFNFANSVLEPNILLRSAKNEKKMDVVLKYYYKDIFWTSLGWSSPSFNSVCVAVKRKNISLGYLFEFSTAPLYKYSYGNHLVFMGYNFN